MGGPCSYCTITDDLVAAPKVDFFWVMSSRCWALEMWLLRWSPE